MVASKKTNVEEIEGPPLNAIVEILSSLNSPDALQIFLYSEKGISSSSKTIKELGLSQKRYYVWLKKLIESGLIEKRDGVYQHTLLGQICLKLGTALQGTLIHGERLKLADKLLRSKQLSDLEKENILRSISGNGLYGAFGITDILHEVKMIVDYDNFIEEGIDLLDSAKESAYIATNRIDLRTKDATFRLIDRDVTFFSLSTEIGASETIETLKMILDPASIKIIQKLVTSRTLNVRVLKDLSYCFLVVDGESGILELPHPISQEFYVAFKFKNAYLCGNLIDVFNSLYENAKEDPRINFVRKTFGIFQDLTGKIHSI